MSAGLLVAWFLGLRLVQEGWTSVRLISEPLSVEALAWPESVREALLAGMQANASITVPIGAAQIVLGLVIVVLSGAALFGGRLPLGFYVQLLGVSGLVTLIGYWLGEPVRRAVVAALVDAPGLAEARELDEQSRSEVYTWGFRFGLLLHLAATGFAIWAVTRRAAREFLAALARPSQN